MAITNMAVAVVAVLILNLMDQLLLTSSPTTQGCVPWNDNILHDAIDRNTNLYFSSFIHGIQLFHLFNSSSVPIKMLKNKNQKISLHFECLNCTEDGEGV